jgi:hypothetical protein
MVHFTETHYDTYGILAALARRPVQWFEDFAIEF